MLFGKFPGLIPIKWQRRHSLVKTLVRWKVPGQARKLSQCESRAGRHQSRCRHRRPTVKTAKKSSQSKTTKGGLRRRLLLAFS